MTKRSYAMTALAVVMLGLYVYYFTDLIRVPHIQIVKIDRPVASRRYKGEVYPVSFMLDGKYHLTMVKVLSLREMETNKHAQPLWYLVTKTNSEMVKGFLYGQPIRGMASVRTNGGPTQLKPNEPYQIQVQAGRAKGELNFVALPLGS